MTVILRLAMIGFGNVGQEFARLLDRKREWLLKSKGLDVEVLVISTRSKGSLMSKRRLDTARAVEELRKGSLRGYGSEYTELSPIELIGKCDADMMIELTTLDIESGQPATDHIKKAMNMGMDVVTANKGPVAFHYDDLARLARSNGVKFRFEGTVMDGTPIFNLVEKTLQGCEVTGIQGILNSTSNFVLTEMASGKTMDEAISKAQGMGLAEADPAMDLDGWDAAAKITALANVLMGAGSDPKKVERNGIRGLSADDVRASANERTKWKLLASAERDGGSIRTFVGPETITPDSPFWSVDGTSSAVTLKTDLMGDLTIIESGPMLTQTAYAIFSDMLLVVDSIRAGTLQ